METKHIEERIVSDLEELISESCGKNQNEERYRELHRDLLRNHYNAADVDIDYHRKRIRMFVLADNARYRPGKVNLNLPVIHVNLLFKNLRAFLTGCLQTDRKSLSFYAQLLRRFRTGKRQAVLY